MTLTQVAKLTKITLFTSATILVVGISGFISYQFWYYRYYLPNKPVNEVLPEVKFGLLPHPLFPQTSVSSSNYQYSLDTETGSLPSDLPKIVQVYFVPQLGTTLLAPNRASTLAENLGFPIGPQVLSSTVYKFSDDIGGELIIDISSGNFQFQRNIASASSSLQKFQVLPDDNEVIGKFRNFLQQRELLKEELDNGRFLVSFEKFLRKDNETATVTVWPEDIDDLKIVTPTFKSGLIQATLTKYDDQLYSFSDLVYTYWEPDKQNSSTYPLRPIEQAFNDLKSGKGTVIIEAKAPKASITNIYLAYFEPGEYVKYIQPIYVFEGDSFVAYVPAISEKYLEE